MVTNSCLRVGVDGESRQNLTLDQICPQLLNTAFNALSLAPFRSPTCARARPPRSRARTHEPAHQCSAQEPPTVPEHSCV